LIDIGRSTAAQASGRPLPALMDFGTTVMQPDRHTTSRSATLGPHPVIHVPNYMDYYSFTDPGGMEG